MRGSDGSEPVDPDGIVGRLLGRYPGTIAFEAWGETTIFHNPGRVLPRGVYLATVKRRDGENDRASRLDRCGVYRLGLGLPMPLFVERFGPPPPRPGKGRAIDGPWDFAVLDTLTPHPVYGWMCWVAVLNPTEGTLAGMDALFEAAHAKAAAVFANRLR